MKIKKLFDRAIENWPVKILSFAFAIILMQFYKSSLLEKRYFSVPLVVENKGDLIPATSIPRIIKISVWGNTKDLEPIKEDDLMAFIDLSLIKAEGDYRIPIKTKIKGLAAETASIEISVLPSELKIKLEKVLSKRVPVKLSLRGSPFKNYEIYQSEIDPSIVEITGPYSEIAKIEELHTSPVSIDSRKSGFSGSTDIFNTNPLVSILGASQAYYSIKIREEIQTKEYANIFLYLDNLREDLELAEDTPKGNLKVRGSKSILENWIPPVNVLRVQCEDIKRPGTYNMPVQAVVPGKLEFINASPKNIKLKIKRRKLPKTSTTVNNRSGGSD